MNHLIKIKKETNKINDEKYEWCDIINEFKKLTLLFYIGFSIKYGSSMNI
jgi:hypothetical protein